MALSDVWAWVKVVVLGLSKWPAKALAPVVVPFLNDEQRYHHPIWGCNDAIDLSYWNIAVRNGAHNMYVRSAVPYVTVAANTSDETMERMVGLQWRYRRSQDGRYVSFRVTWGEPRDDKGKREFYIGWTMSGYPWMRLTFFQLRPF